jgi:hypothetical protein
MQLDVWTQEVMGLLADADAALLRQVRFSLTELVPLPSESSSNSSSNSNSSSSNHRPCLRWFQGRLLLKAVLGEGVTHTTQMHCLCVRIVWHWVPYPMALTGAAQQFCAGVFGLGSIVVGRAGASL